MTYTTHPSTTPATHGPENAITLALSLAQAERAIHEFTAGQLDAIVDADGNAHLLRPAQEQLRQNESRLQAIVDSAADVITVVSRRGMIVSQSQAVRRVLGYEPEELVGKSIFELIHEGDINRLYTAFFYVIEGFEQGATVQFHHPTRNGPYRLIEATLGQMVVDGSKSVVLGMRPIGAPRLPRDETPREAIAVPVERARDRLLAMVAHELRTPLTPVLLGVTEMEADERFAEAHPILAMMRRNLEVQTRLIEELTDFALVGEHKVRLRLEAIDVHETISHVLEICQSELDAAGITARLSLGASPSVVVADSVRLQQVMWNLLRNAIKFSAPGSSIAIATTGSLPNHLTIDFADRGIGIEPALLPRVFDAFHQGSQSEHNVRGGLGLGLFIARGLAEAQGGTLTAFSAGWGCGATFRLVLKTSPTPEGVAWMETPPPTSAAHSARSEKP